MNQHYPARRLRVNGIDMHVVVAGEGEPVLLVHGYPDCHEVWRHQIPALVAAGYQVIAPDTRGCGDTEISPAVSDYRVANLVADLIALLDILEIGQVRLVGHDWGAAICWQLAINHPLRVERYIPMSVGHPNAYAAAGIVQKLRGYYILVLQLRGLAKWLFRTGHWLGLRRMTRYPPETARWIARLARPGRLRAGMNYYRANIGMVLARAAPAVTMPVSALWSDGDAFLTEGQMTDSRRFVDAPWRYIRVAGASHWLQLDAPEQVNRLLLDFLK